MDVYLDAVFYPEYLQRDEIFSQEGWQLSAGKARKDQLIYNGVVYNEMKGAFSSPEDVLDQRRFSIPCSRIPPTAWSPAEIPACIPDLSYEEFLDFHRTYYHPANSYIYIVRKCGYGRSDWNYLDREYLSAFDSHRGRLQRLFYPEAIREDAYGDRKIFHFHSEIPKRITLTFPSTQPSAAVWMWRRPTPMRSLSTFSFLPRGLP